MMYNHSSSEVQRERMKNSTKSIVIGMGGMILIASSFKYATGLLSAFGLLLALGVFGYALWLQDQPDE